jgi:hypothetical protein
MRGVFCDISGARPELVIQPAMKHFGLLPTPPYRPVLTGACDMEPNTSVPGQIQKISVSLPEPQRSA